MTRKYELRRRAERQAETRRRIVEATVQLHGTVGPRHTQVSEIAGLAGVERVTVYRHFPDDASLYRACSAHFLGKYPPPEVESWASVADPGERLRTGLGSLYVYFAEHERLIANIQRDADMMGIEVEFLVMKERTVEVLSAGWGARGRRKKLVGAAIDLACHFHTWRTLVRDRSLASGDAVELMVSLVRTAATG